VLKFFKYLIYLLITLSLVLFYFLFTPLGNASLYKLLSQQITKNIEVQIEIQSIDILHYPQVRIVAHIQRKAKLMLYGHLDKKRMDMNYTLNSNCIAIEECHIDDIIDIQGSIKGKFERLVLEGKGTALDGKISYQATKYEDKVEDIQVDMRDINSSKLFKLLGQSALIQGKAHAHLNFSVMSNSHKQGSITYEVSDDDFHGIPVYFYTKAIIQDNEHTFIMDLLSPYFTLNITKGTYNQEQRTAQAHYVLDIPNLSKLEPLFGYKYQGNFYAIGEMSYAKYFTVTGLSKSFGGLSDFIFEKESLKVELQDVLLHEIMNLFPIPSILTANATGKLSYNLLEETLVVNTKLTNAKFLHCKLVDIIRKKSGANMLHETFNDSSLNFTYHNAIILGDLNLANNKSHININHTHINTKENTINAFFDFKMQKQEFSGKVYGDLDDPKINLNMQKLIRYQMDKQVDKLIGKNNRKMMESMPMGNVAKEIVTDVGVSFMKVFF